MGGLNKLSDPALYRRLREDQVAMVEVPHGDVVPDKDGATARETASLVEGLVARSGALKSELVEFSQHTWFARQLTARLKAAQKNGFLDEGIAVRTLDHFALQQRLHDGTTVVERFVEHRQPPLAADEREMILGWSNVVEGMFEVHRADDGTGTLVLHNLIDDLRYLVHCNMGPEVLVGLEVGMFACCRIVPIHPATDHWLISGHLSPYAQSARHEAAHTALRMATADPSLLRRNPDLCHRAWQIQAEDRAAFIGLFGSDIVIMPPGAAQEALTEHYQRRQEEVTASAEATGKPTRPATDSTPTPEQISQLPDHYMEADSVGLIYDEIEGLNYYLEFGRLDALFANPALAHDHAYVGLLSDYLSDDTVSPLPLRRLVERNPDGTDSVFRALLGDPSFSWHLHGEDLLRSRKKAFFQQGASPGFAVVGERLAELLCTPQAKP
ncbi:hypothetical protein ACFWIB_42095 [Streptomyces sp. NPDC127051]|uniref:hypothetical protein n=1 Tax=Streptomyces sp. NPDC127051 TaxID=3347119 RepID=UPI003652F90C